MSIARLPVRLNSTNSPTKHIMIMLSKTKFLKATNEKNKMNMEGCPNDLTPDSLAENLAGRTA
jgi:hypothetical protein